MFPKILPVPIKENVLLLTNNVVQFVYNIQKPLPIFMVAKVTIKDGIFVLEIINPLKAPTNVPQIIEITMAKNIGNPCLAIKPALITDVTPIIEPTDKSIPPIRITIVIPQIKNTFTDICRITLKIFWVDKKDSVLKARTTNTIAKASRTPNRFLTLWNILPIKFILSLGNSVFKVNSPYK